MTRVGPIGSPPARIAARRVNIVQSDKPDEMIAADVIADAIVAIADGMKKINASRLNFDAIVLLIHESSKVGKPDVRRVLQAIDQLGNDYLKPNRRA